MMSARWTSGAVTDRDHVGVSHRVEHVLKELAPGQPWRRSVRLTGHRDPR